jgi:hypothetical protein
VPYDQQWYENNRAASAARNKRNKRAKFDWIAAYKKSNGCRVCGETDPVVLDLHHRNPAEKDDAVPTGIRWGRGWKWVKDETAKCDVLCANCHRREHHG